MSGGRLLVVVNPNASRAARSLGAATAALFAEGFALDIRPSRGLEEVHDLILRESGAADAIVIGGGDGSADHRFRLSRRLAARFSSVTV